MRQPRNGKMKISRIQPALATPDRSLRRKMSLKMAMKIQIAMTQKNNATVVHRMSPRFNVQTPYIENAGSWVRQARRALRDHRSRPRRTRSVAGHAIGDRTPERQPPDRKRRATPT